MNYYYSEYGVKTRCEHDSMHTVIFGKPGCGKTEVAKIIAKIYSKLGVLKTDEVVYAKTADFIGAYVGHTEKNTTELLEKARGKVLFYDEAYSLGDNSKNITSFSKTAINIINDYLEKYKHEFIFIIAGYKENLTECFFNVNRGLKRRFRWTYEIDEYTPKELLQIFFKTVKDTHWKITLNAITEKFFEKNSRYFPYFGGDINIFLDRCTKAHTKRVFMKEKNIKLLTKEDIQKGFEMYKNYKNIISPNNEISNKNYISMFA